MTIEADLAEPPVRRRVRAKLVALAAVVVLLVAGGITATAVSFHYLHARPIECACGLSWDVPPGVDQRQVEIGSHSGVVIRPAGGTRVAFRVLIANWSSVTQTILGTTQDLTALHARVEYSRSDGEDGDAEGAGYRTGELTLPPGGGHWIRYTFLAPCDEVGTTLSWDGLDVRVRVGAFTRTEYIDFDYTFAMKTVKSNACR